MSSTDKAWVWSQYRGILDAVDTNECNEEIEANAVSAGRTSELTRFYLVLIIYAIFGWIFPIVATFITIVLFLLLLRSAFTRDFDKQLLAFPFGETVIKSLANLDEFMKRNL
jgi:hypothetical protein